MSKSELEQMYSNAARAVTELNGAKWNTTKVGPSSRPSSVIDKTESNGKAPPVGQPELKAREKLSAHVNRKVKDEGRLIEAEVHKTMHTEVDRWHGMHKDAMKDIDAREEGLKELFEEMRPKQFNIQMGDQITSLGELEGHQHYLFNELIQAVHTKDRKGHRKNVILKGPAGSGKSTGGFNLAKLLGFDFFYIGQTLMPHQIEGYVRQGDGVYQSTFFTQAYQRPSVLMLEEMDAWSPQATLVANPPLANGYMALPNGEMIDRHPDCIIIACANTWGHGATAEYVGRNKLDAAFLDRFAIRFDWNYDDALERAAADNDDLVSKVQTARFNADKAGLKVLISPRASIDCADMVRAGFTEKRAFELNFLSSLGRDQRKTVLQGIDLEG
ncbi:MAG: AAA domain-containing protein [Ilumatobacter sp.]|nr:AAA domain-containing protein [Ilumatobacter sp.]